MRRYPFILISLLAVVVFLICLNFSGKTKVEAAANLQLGDLIKTVDTSAVYLVSQDNKRYVFPNESIFFSWYSAADFANVKTISSSEMASLPIGGNVTIRPGTKLVKITTDPKVYAVTKSGLRWVASEAIAVELYGSDWAKRVVDVSEAFWLDYSFGPAIETAVHPKGTLIKKADSGAIYLMEDNGKADVFNNYSSFAGNGFQEGDVIETNKSYESSGNGINKFDNSLRYPDKILTSTPDQNQCSANETKKYTCADGTQVSWCGCENGQWSCIISPENQCPEENKCTDNDGDGYGASGSSGCSKSGVDCNDNASAINPGATEVCGDGNDNDCDWTADENCQCSGNQTQQCGPSTDTGACQYGIQTCSGGQWGNCTGAVYSTTEVCSNNLDDDCDGQTDECSCSDGTAYGQCSTTKPKYCNNGTLVNQCSTCGCSSGQSCQSNGSCQQVCSDGTSYGQCSTTKPKYCENGNLINKCSQCSCPSGQQCQSNGSCLTCTDSDGDGYYSQGGNCGTADCNDSNANVHPGATEICNGIDDDCDGTTDEGCQTCSDGTTYGQCAANNKPKECVNGVLVNNCSKCGCDGSKDCTSWNICKPVSSNPNQNPIWKVVYPVNLEFYVVGDIYTGYCAPLGDDNCCPVGNLKFKNNANFKGVKTTDPDLNSYEQKMYVKQGWTAQEIQTLKTEIEKVRTAIKNNTNNALDVQVSYVELTGTTNMSKWGCGIMPHPIPMAEIISPYLSINDDFAGYIHDATDNVTGTYIPFYGGGFAFGPDAGIKGLGYYMVREMTMGYSYHELAHTFDLTMKATAGPSDIADMYALFYYDGQNYIYNRYYPSCGQGNSNKLKWFPGADDCTTDPDWSSCGPGSCASPDAFIDHIFNTHYNSGYAVIGNHCRDGRKDFNETGVDSGGWCS